jgi:hypothetical protein
MGTIDCLSFEQSICKHSFLVHLKCQLIFIDAASYHCDFCEATLPCGLVSFSSLLPGCSLAWTLVYGRLLGKQFFLCVGDSPRGPLKQRGNPHLKPATKPKTQFA